MVLTTSSVATSPTSGSTPADGGRGDRAGPGHRGRARGRAAPGRGDRPEARRARRPPTPGPHRCHRQAAVHPVEPASGRVHRQALPVHRAPPPRPGAGGEPRPDPGGREVRPPQGASSSRPTPRGGSARPSGVASPTRAAPSGCPRTWSTPCRPCPRRRARCSRQLGREPTAAELGRAHRHARRPGRDGHAGHGRRHLPVGRHRGGRHRARRPPPRRQGRGALRRGRRRTSRRSSCATCCAPSATASARCSSCASAWSANARSPSTRSAASFELTRERIRQIEAKALTKLRHPCSPAQRQGRAMAV